MLAQFARVLADEQVKEIHEASLVLLEEVGLLVRNEEARRLFQAHGCRLDAGEGIVRFPRQVVEANCRLFPRQFRFYGRDPRYDITLPDDGPVISTSGSAPNVIDLETGAERRATSADIARMAHLVNALPGIDIFSIPTLADDAPPGMFSLSRFYPAVKNCLKPVMSGSLNPRETADIVRMAEIVAGGAEAYRRRPFITFLHCSTVSPLTMDFDSTTVCLDYARQGLPAMGVVVPNGGLTAPLTLAGTLVVANAEFLAVSILAQMAREATPVVYYALPTVGDMRSGAYAPGGIETGILLMACAQMARFYQVPSGGYVGLTNAKLPDAQAGYEKGMSPLAGMLGGTNLLVMAGLIDALMAFSFPQAAIDSEIGGMIKRVHRGMAVDEESLALGLIREVGPGGMFLDRKHTLAHMRTAAHLPALSDRSPRRTWQEAGSPDTARRALEQVRQLLGSDNPALLSPEVDAAIRRAFPGLVAGDSRLPASWPRPPAPAASRGRKRRIQP